MATDRISAEARSEAQVGGNNKLPGSPSPPRVGKVTHHSIELTWHPPEYTGGCSRLKYCLQEEELSKSQGYRNAYSGYATAHHITGLKVLTRYQYRLQAINEFGHGPWSSSVTVVTNRQPQTCENLHKAIQKSDVETVESVLEEFPEYINVPDIMGSSPLMSASSLGKDNVANVLLELGADVEYKNSSGKTCLMEACFHGNLDIIKLLIKHGASWLSRDHSGFSALHYAVDGGHTNVVSYILSEGVPADEVGEQTLSGWTPLMRTAVMGGNADVARILLEKGADVNRRDHEGKTVLMLASVNGFENLVRVLLEYGANPHLKNEFGKNAIDFAESFERQRVLNVFKTLADDEHK